MITQTLVEQHVTTQNNISDHSELSRLLAAAVVSRQFCNMLLTNPSLAIKNGFAGEKFTLSADEYEMVLSALSGTLPEFAQKLGKFFPAPRPAAKYVMYENNQLRI